jgi:hypothetical protein
MVMLKEILFIHPLGQAAALVFCVFNLLSGLTRKCFFIPVHINVGVMLYALTLIGSVVGVLVARNAATHDMNISSPFHIGIAALLLLVLSCGMVSGFLLLAKAKVNQGLLRAMHRYCNLVVVVLFGSLLLSGVRTLVTVL